MVLLNAKNDNVLIRLIWLGNMSKDKRIELMNKSWRTLRKFDSIKRMSIVLKVM